jgi:hypothetical protein
MKLSYLAPLAAVAMLAAPTIVSAKDAKAPPAKHVKKEHKKKTSTTTSTTTN